MPLPDATDENLSLARPLRCADSHYKDRGDHLDRRSRKSRLAPRQRSPRRRTYPGGVRLADERAPRSNLAREGQRARAARGGALPQLRLGNVNATQSGAAFLLLAFDL